FACAKRKDASKSSQARSIQDEVNQGGATLRRGSRVTRMAAFALWAAVTCDAPAFAGPYSRLLVLLPGETAAPGTSSGKTGTPTAQTVGVPFSVTVRACDNTWTTVTSVTDQIQILSSDASATLPPSSLLSAGVGTFQVTFNAAGTFHVFAHDLTD